MSNEQLEQALEAERISAGFHYAVGVCPLNLNGNNQGWCHTVQWFRTKEERDDRARELSVELHDTCDTTYCWEEEIPLSNSYYTRTTPRVR